jgi:hypothetical protein
VQKIKGSLLDLLHSGSGVRLLLVIFALLVISIIFVGLNDVPGYVLGYLASSILFLILVRRWRSIKNYVILLLASICGIIFLSFFYVEVISRIAVWLWGPGTPDGLPMRIIEVVVSNIMLFAGPVGVAFGLGGAVLLGVLRIFGVDKQEHPVDGT